MNKIKSLEPFLAPNKVIGKNISTSILRGRYGVSDKLDGIRTLFVTTEMLTRSLKQVRNKQLQDKFQHINMWAIGNRILDGEMYHHDLTFQAITSLCMTEDFMNKKTFKKLNKISKTDEEKDIELKHKLLSFYKLDIEGNPISFNNPLQFYCFDTLDIENQVEPFEERIRFIPELKDLVKVEQRPFNFPEDVDLVKPLFEKRLKENYEGLMIKSFSCPYRYGRATVNEAYIFKYKPFETHDAIIIEVIQSTEVRKGAEKTTNELGRSVTSKKKADRVLIEKASAFLVEYEGLRFKVSIAESDPEKKKIWEEREKYVGAWVEFEAMYVGVKTNPRHPVTKRMRWDKG